MGSYCGKACSPKSMNIRPANLVRPDIDFNPIEYADAARIMGMYERANKLDMNKSGGSYDKIGPDLLAGYAQGTSNSGSYSMSSDYIGQIAASRGKDFGYIFVAGYN